MKKEAKVYGYVRISDATQKIHRQMDYMKELGIPERNIFIDRQSGKDFNRPEYQRMVKKLKHGDTLYVKELDRLGRNKEEIKDELDRFKKKGVRVKITNIPTTMEDFHADDLIASTVNNIIIEVLAAIAEQERITTRKLQAEGIAAAKARGIHFGRDFLKLPSDFPIIYEKWVKKEMTRREVLDYYDIDTVKFSSMVRSYRHKNHLR